MTRMGWGLTLLAVLAASTEVRAAGTAAEPILSRQKAFRIPFHIDPAERGRTVDVQLFVSKDRGRTWAKAGSAGPDQAAFAFRVPEDGEYWFAVRTADRRGQTYPPSTEPYVPALKVVVDSHEPRLTLLPLTRLGSEVGVEWEASDATLDLTSLRVEYAGATGEGWHRVPVAPLAKGQTRWIVGGPAAVSVRARIKDRAGNLATTQVQIDAYKAPEARRAVSKQPPTPAPSHRRMMEQITFEASSNEAVSLEEEAPPEEASAPTHVTLRQLEPDDAEDTAEDSEETPGAVGSQAPPAEAAVEEPPSSRKLPPETALERRVLGRRIPTAAAPAASPASSPKPDPEGTPDTKAGRRPVTTPASSPAKTVPPVSSPKSDPEGAPDTEAARAPLTRRAPAPDLPAWERAARAAPTRSVLGTPRFKLSYSVDQVGASGVGSVELWVTEDGGVSWQRYGEDADRRSPFPVDFGREGTFGLTLVVRNGIGVGGEAPKPGSAPLQWIEVDLTPPDAELYTTKIAEVDEACLATILWRAADKNLAPKPVSLYYSDAPDGPWVKIDGPLDNTGRYVWEVPDELALGFHLRIEVRDLAGNVGRVKTDRPVIVDPSPPLGRIRGIESNANVER